MEKTIDIIEILLTEKQLEVFKTVNEVRLEFINYIIPLGSKYVDTGFYLKDMDKELKDKPYMQMKIVISSFLKKKKLTVDRKHIELLFIQITSRLTKSRAYARRMRVKGNPLKETDIAKMVHLDGFSLMNKNIKNGSIEIPDIGTLTLPKSFKPPKRKVKDMAILKDTLGYKLHIIYR